MTLAYPHYKNLVIAAYKKKLQNGELSPLLATITRGSIRQQCLNVYKERIQNGEKEERNVLEAFFGIPPEGENFASQIEFFNLNKFRQIEKLVKKGMKNPGSENVELLAWLIDFPHRPYGREVFLNAEEIAMINKTSEEPDNAESEEEDLIEDEMIFEEDLTSLVDPGAFSESNQQDNAVLLKEDNQAGQTKEKHKQDTMQWVLSDSDKKKGKKKWLVHCLILGFVLIGGAYILWQREQNSQMIAGITNAGCMYWTGDHYEQTPCNPPQAGRLVLPFDKEKKDKFQRILRVDTITAWSIDKIYYIQNNGGYEFYTAGGMHPIETTRYLRKLTRTVFNSQFGQRSEVSNP